MKSDELNFATIVPSSDNDVIKDGNIVSIDEGSHITLYIAHRQSILFSEEGEPMQITEAYPIRVEKPLTRDKAINAAEMQAYKLVTPFDVASFGTALGRKYRENPMDSEVIEHGEFIRWVKSELTKIGV